MGTVWEARHGPSGRRAAVKVLSPEHAGSSRLRAAFRNEVRAAAALDHPHVIALYDHGVVDAATAEASEGRLTRRAPWLAMELAEGGDLVERCGRLDAGQVLAVLRALLDALAHAHARRVLHRDLKPANLVLGGLRPGIKLTDFGLADLGSDGRPGGGGTPAYMSPEQLSHRWRSFGPWTDLYAVGCVGWALLTGEPPFGHEVSEVVHWQAQGPQGLPLDGLEPLEAWLRRLLSVRPQARFGTAAEAARALSQLSPELSAGLSDSLEGPTLDVPTVQALPTLDWFVTDAATAPETEPAGSEAGGDVAPAVVRGVGVPLDWRAPGARASRTLLAGAGLSLLRLRPPPLVGRERERDRLWEALRTAVRRKRPRVVLLTGGAGSGKSRLAEWCGQRAHELAAATVLRATHGPTGGAPDGLGPMVRRALRADGLTGPALRAHLMARLGTDTELVASTAALLEPDGGHGIVLGGAEERARVLVEVLRRWGRGGPVVVWLDDAHWSTETLDVVHRLVRPEPALRLLVVATIRNDLLSEVPRAASLLEDLTGLGAEQIPIGPLEGAAILVRDALGLEEGLAAEIATRTGGMPLFAVQLVEDWLDRGLLEAGAHGFRLAQDDTLSLPPTLDGVWLDRVERLLEGRGGDDGAALERAAVLGVRVDPEEWASACADLDAEPDDLREALLDHRLAVAADDGRAFTWVHGLLRESLLARAGQGDRLRGHHRACADAVRGIEGPDQQARLGRHLLLSGQAAEACGPLLAGAERYIKTGDHGQGVSLLGGWERAMREAGVPDDDRRWAIGLLRRAEVSTFYDLLTEDGVSRALQVARAGGHGREEALTLRLRAVVHLDRGRLDACAEDLEHAWTLVPDDAEVQIKLATVRATLLRSQGQLARAAEALEGALALLPGTDGLETGNLYVQLGLLADTRGRYDEAERAFDRALAAYRARGVRRGIAQSLNGHAEAIRHRGEPERALPLYQEALRLYEAIGGAEILYVRANLAIIELERGSFGTAGAVLGPAVSEAEAAGQGWLLGIIHALHAAASAGTGAWRTAERHLEEAAESLARTGVVDPDLPRTFELAAEVAERGGRASLAQRCRQLAEAQRAASSSSGGDLLPP